MVFTNDVNGARLQLPPHVSAAPSGECCRLFVVFHEQHLAHELLYPPSSRGLGLRGLSLGVLIESVLSSSALYIISGLFHQPGSQTNSTTIGYTPKPWVRSVTKTPSCSCLWKRPHDCEVQPEALPLDSGVCSLMLLLSSYSL